MAIHTIKVTVRGTNRNSVGLLHMARRQLDYLGPRGIVMKRGKTDEACKEAGGLELDFPNERMMQKYIDRVEELCDPALHISEPIKKKKKK